MLLKVEHLRVAFRTEKGLSVPVRDVSFEIPENGRVALVGESGCGKTTITRRIMREFGDNVSVLHHDSYYKRHDDLSYEERCKLNYDHPKYPWRVEALWSSVYNTTKRTMKIAAGMQLTLCCLTYSTDSPMATAVSKISLFHRSLSSWLKPSRSKSIR